MIYWSNSKLADAIRGTIKPTAASFDEWDEWETQAQQRHPFRYWIAEEVLDSIQTFVRFPLDWLHGVKYWLVNRFVTKTHALTSNLKRGQWHEFDTRMLHGLFDELVNFVEVEQAWHHVMWDDETRTKYKAPFWAVGPLRTRTWRCPEAGVDYLNWAAALVNEDGTSTNQAITAKETLALYRWWKDVYPNRSDPYDASGWSELCHRPGFKMFGAGRSVEDDQEMSKSLDLCNKIEDAYDAEDEQMLVRLIRIRKGLWT